MFYKIYNKDINKLALAVGHLFGDGGIQDNGRIHYCNSENFLIKEFIDSMKIFNVTPWVKKEYNVTRVRYSTKIGKALWSIFGKFSYGKDTKTITQKIKNMHIKWKIKMIRAWFNDDGSVINSQSNYKVISIKQKLKHLIVFIKGILEELDIKSTIMEDDGNWLLRICGYENITKFRNNINFSFGYRKYKELDKMINSINRPHMVMKNRILEILTESPKTRKELNMLLKIKTGTIYGHLHGWKRREIKSNLGLIDLGLIKVKKEGRKNVYSLSTDQASPGFGYEVGTAGSSGSCG